MQQIVGLSSFGAVVKDSCEESPRLLFRIDLIHIKPELPCEITLGFSCLNPRISPTMYLPYKLK